jgi:hypothetical protein
MVNDEVDEGRELGFGIGRNESRDYSIYTYYVVLHEDGDMDI